MDMALVMADVLKLGDEALTYQSIVEQNLPFHFAMPPSYLLCLCCYYSGPIHMFSVFYNCCSEC